MFYLEFIIQRVFKIFIPHIFPQDSAIYLILYCSLCVVGLHLNLSVGIVTFYSLQFVIKTIFCQEQNMGISTFFTDQRELTELNINTKLYHCVK